MHPMEGHSSNGTEYCENGQREDFDLIIIGGKCSLIQTQVSQGAF